MHLFTFRKIDGNLKKLGRTSTTRPAQQSRSIEQQAIKVIFETFYL